MKILTILFVAVLLTCGCLSTTCGVLHSGEDIAPFAQAGLPFELVPNNAELLDESGALALFSGETAEDTAYNKTNSYASRNSLFLRRRKSTGTEEWRILLTTGSEWGEVDEMSAWCSTHARDIKSCFCVCRARFALDGYNLWLVCDVGNPWYAVVCSYDMQSDIFRVLMDGADITEEPDGTIRVANKKFYPADWGLYGAAWHDVWMTPDGKVVREGEITLRGCDL